MWVVSMRYTAHHLILDISSSILIRAIALQIAEYLSTFFVRVACIMGLRSDSHVDISLARE